MSLQKFAEILRTKNTSKAGQVCKLHVLFTLLAIQWLTFHYGTSYAEKVKEVLMEYTPGERAGRRAGLGLLWCEAILLALEMTEAKLNPAWQRVMTDHRILKGANALSLSLALHWACSRMHDQWEEGHKGQTHTHFQVPFTLNTLTWLLKVPSQKPSRNTPLSLVHIGCSKTRTKKCCSKIIFKEKNIRWRRNKISYCNKCL